MIREEEKEKSLEILHSMEEAFRQELAVKDPGVRVAAEEEGEQTADCLQAESMKKADHTASRKALSFYRAAENLSDKPSPDTPHALPSLHPSMKKAVSYLLAMPNGIQAMSADVEGLVETSLNLGMMKLTKEHLRKKILPHPPDRGYTQNLFRCVDSLHVRTIGNAVKAR